MTYIWIPESKCLPLESPRKSVTIVLRAFQRSLSCSELRSHPGICQPSDGHVIGDKPKRRPDGLLYIPLHQHPGYKSQCLILISLLVFRVLTFILVREQGLVGTEDEAASIVRGHVEEWPLCACQRSHRNQNCSEWGGQGWLCKSADSHSWGARTGTKRSLQPGVQPVPACRVLWTQAFKLTCLSSQKRPEQTG